jgi:hypothetical protein
MHFAVHSAYPHAMPTISASGDLTEVNDISETWAARTQDFFKEEHEDICPDNRLIPNPPYDCLVPLVDKDLSEDMMTHSFWNSRYADIMSRNIILQHYQNDDFI